QRDRPREMGARPLFRLDRRPRGGGGQSHTILPDIEGNAVSSVERSPWLIHYDASSCNGCDIEVLACLTPVYDAERFGCIVTGDPKQADIFLVTGSVNHLNAP